MTLWRQVLTAGLLVSLAGCARGPVVNDMVEGTIKLNGVPLAVVRLNFIPQTESGERLPGSTAMTDDKGYYRLAFDDLKPGAIVGKHRVVVMQGRPDPDQPTRPTGPNPPVPPAYMIASQTPLQVEVTLDKHVYELNVTP
jgi:hypothetical protein